MSIDDIINLIQLVAKTGGREIFEVVKNILPKPVAAVVGWSLDHADCLTELIAALRGSLSSGGVGNDLIDIQQDVVACQRLAA